MTKYPGNEFDPAEWVRAWRRLLGVMIVLAIAGALFTWIGRWDLSMRTQYAMMTGAFLGALIGFGVLSWTVYYVGRQIARVLWGLLVIAEQNEQQRETLRRQRDHLFNDTTAASRQARR